MSVVQKTGFMTKRGPGSFIPSWKYRYFVLTTECLFYYRRVDNDIPRGTIPLRVITNVQREPQKDTQTRFYMSVQTGSDSRNGRIFIIYHGSIAEVEDWVEVIKETVERNRMFTHGGLGGEGSLAAGYSLPRASHLAAVGDDFATVTPMPRKDSKSSNNKESSPQNSGGPSRSSPSSSSTLPTRGEDIPGIPINNTSGDMDTIGNATTIGTVGGVGMESSDLFSGAVRQQPKAAPRFQRPRVGAAGTAPNPRVSHLLSPHVAELHPGATGGSPIVRPTAGFGFGGPNPLPPNSGIAPTRQVPIRRRNSRHPGIQHPGIAGSLGAPLMEPKIVTPHDAPNHSVLMFCAEMDSGEEDEE